MATDREILEGVKQTIQVHFGAPVVQPDPTTVIPVNAGATTQVVYDSAPAGSTLAFEAGATFPGFVAHRKEGADPCTRISLTTRDWPGVAPGMPGLAELRTRVGQMAKIQPVDRAGFGIDFPPQAGCLALHGIAIEPVGPSGQGSHLRFGSGEATQRRDRPSHLRLTQVYLRGDLAFGTKFGLNHNGTDVEVEHLWADEVFYNGEDSCAIGGRIGTRLTARYCYLAAGGENIILGGAKLHGGPDLTPEDWDVSDVILHKPLRWKTDGKNRQVKNLFELKFGKRLRLQRALMVNNWAAAQDGRGILLNYSTNGNCPAIDGLEDVTLEDIALLNSPGGLNIQGYSWQPDSFNEKKVLRVLLRNWYYWAGPGHTGRPISVANVRGRHDLRIERATLAHGATTFLLGDYGWSWQADPLTGVAVRVPGGPIAGLALVDSVVTRVGTYQITAPASSHFGQGLATFCPIDCQMAGNILGGASSSLISRLNALQGAGTANVPWDAAALQALFTRESCPEVQPGTGADPSRIQPLLDWLQYLPEP